MSEWISVKDQSPPVTGRPFIVYYPNAKRTYICFFTRMNECDGYMRMVTDPDAEDVDPLSFTHWMPLPETPKE